MDRQIGKSRNTAIQLFRIFACLVVFGVHFGQRTQLGGVIRRYTDFGAYGVQMFFIISGLLAAKGLDGKNDYRYPRNYSFNHWYHNCS